MNRIKSISLLSILFLASCTSLDSQVPAPERQPVSTNDSLSTNSADSTDAVIAEQKNSVDAPIIEYAAHCEPDTTEQSRWISDAKFAAAKLPAAHASVWSRVVAGYQLPQLNNTRIEQQLRWFQRNPDYMLRVSKRANPYLFHVTDEIQKAGLPMEIALLPVVESAFNPYAYSRSRALGIWQFISTTGKRFDLQQNGWYDGRRDIRESTRAAISYLSYLHRLFDNDWLLALAAYNTGEGNLRKAIRRNERAGKKTDFWNLRLPSETRDYVPRLLALAKLVQEPHKYGNELLAISNEDKWTAVDLGGQSDLAAVATLIDLPQKELAVLNPGFNHGLTPPNGPHEILVPLNRVQALEQALASKDLDLAPARSEFEYTVRYGDTLSEIAQRYSVGLSALRTRNGLRSNRIRGGQTLQIPDQFPSNQLSRAPVQITHRVQRGETLSELAEEYRVNIRDLADWNSMRSLDSIRAGKKLLIWTSVAQQ